MKTWLVAIGLLMIGSVVAVGLTAAAVLGSYNSLIRSHEAIPAQWSQVENVLQRRNDLIPNLVETVKGYAGHERKTFEAVTAARADGVAAGATRDRAKNVTA